MNEFDLINKYFKHIIKPDNEIILGIGDDAACIAIKPHNDLLISTDTLVAGVHFLDDWDPFDIAYKSMMVNISDIVAMAGIPRFITLAITLPEKNLSWLNQFSKGIKSAADIYQVSLIGGDTTKGPLSITITILGVVEKNKTVTRRGAKVFDEVMVSGPLGAAALALHNKKISEKFKNKYLPADQKVLFEKLHYPKPASHLVDALSKYATSAIDISDGLSSDLNHILEQSKVGATITFDKIPVHSLVKKYGENNYIDFALNGGDDYELCFTVPSDKVNFFVNNLDCYHIGTIEKEPGLRGVNSKGDVQNLKSKGYSHF